MPDENIIRNKHSRSFLFIIRMLAWVTASLFLLSFLFSFLAVIALHAPPIQRQIISRGIARIEAVSNLKLQVSSYKWRPFSGIYLNNVKIESEGKQILDCDKVRLSYKLSLKPPHIFVEKVYLEKPFLQLERSSDGRWLIPTRHGEKSQGLNAMTENAPPGPFWANTPLPSIQIVSGTVEAIQQGNTVLSIKDISGAVHLKTVNGAGGPQIQMEIEDIHASGQIGGSGTWDINGSGVIAGKQLQLRSMYLTSSDGCKIEATGQWDLEDVDKGNANLIVNNFSAETIPSLQPYLNGISAVSGSIRLTHSAGKWTFDHDISTDLGSVKGMLQIEKTPAGQNKVDLDSQFARLKVHLSQRFPDSVLNGRISINALMEDENLLDAEFYAHLDPSAVGAEVVHFCDLNGTFADRVLNINSNATKCSLGDLRFRLTADLRGLTDPGHTGGIKAEISLDKGNLEKIDSRLRQKVSGQIALDANYDPGNFTNLKLWQVKIDAKLNVPESISLNGSGTYKNQQVKAEYDFDLINAEKLNMLIPQWQGKGRVASRGILSGKLPELFWDGEISWERFQYLNYQADKLVAKGRGKLTGKDERREISLMAQNATLNGKKVLSLNLDLDQQRDSCAFKLKGEGILNQISARLSGTLEKIWDFPRIAVLTQGQIDSNKVSGTVGAKFDVEKDEIKIHSASFQRGREKVALKSGAISDSKVELSLSIESIDAAKTLELLDVKNRVSGGALSGQIQVSGRPDQPECKLSLQGNDLIIPDNRGSHKIEMLTIQGNYSREILAVQGAAKASEVRSPMAISAKIPVRLSFKPPQFELKLSEPFDSDIRVSGLNAEELLPYINVLSETGGRLDGDVHCEGSLKQPAVNGSGTWQDGAFTTKRWPHSARNIQAEWQVDSKYLYVKKAEISHLGGTVSITGQVDYPLFRIYNFKADGRDLQVQDIYGITGKVSGHAEIDDNHETARLTGALSFSSAEMNLGKLETNIAQNIEIVETNGSGNVLEVKGAKGPSEFLNRLSMDVLLNLPQSGTWVSGKGLKAEINGSLRLKKDASKGVTLAGELQALRGVYNFQGRELKIVEGSLVFPGTPSTDPQLRILCRKDVKDITVQAQVSGPVSHPKVALSSIPAMNQVDILSYFMFDRPAGDLSASQSSQLQGSAAAWLGSEGSGIIKSVLGNNALAPDALGYRSYNGKYDHRFSYDQSQADLGKETGIVEIGKDVTPDLHVVYGREVKGTEGNGNEVQVEYRLNKTVSLRSQVGAEQTGVDIFWRHDFGK